MPGAAPLKSGFDSHLADLKQVLSADAMHTLIMLVSATQDPSFADDERCCNGGLPVVALPFIREPLRPIAQTSYARLLGAVGDWRDLLDAEAFGLIGELAQVCGESRGEYKADQEVFADKGGAPVVVFDQPTGRCRLYDKGVLVCDGLIDPDRAYLDDLVYEGFVRTPGYIGSLRGGKMHGYGKRVSRYDGSVLAEGEWVEGELLLGTEYDWVVAIPGCGSLGEVDSDTSAARIGSKWFQVGEDLFAAHRFEDIAKEVALRHLPVESDEDKAALGGLEIMYVANVEVDGDREQLTNVRRLDDVVDISAIRALLKERIGSEIGRD